MLLATDQIRSLNASQLAAADKLFSSAVIQDFAKKGKSALFARLACESGLDALVPKREPIGAFFDCVFELLRREPYRHEYAYKAALTHKQLLGVHSLKTAAMLTEFRVGSSKADIAIINGTSTVYEIKSDRDKLSRLESQIHAYRRVFARVNVITGEKHLHSVLCSMPDDVGVLVLTRQFKIKTIREAINAPERVDSVAILESITRSEAIRILDMLGREVPCLPNTQMHGALRKLFEQCPPAEVHACMVNVLKETRSLLPMAELINDVPKSLQAAVISTSIRKQDYGRLLEAVRTPKEDALGWA